MDSIFSLFERVGRNGYIGEAITQEEHMTQAAKFATDAGYDDETVLGALFHDIGHLIGFDNKNSKQMIDENGDDLGTADHESIGASYLVTLGFPPKTVDIVKRHVDAKRYLCYKNPAYYAKLSDASKGTLRLQGGPMTEDEAAEFENDPLSKTILAMRTWDEAAKVVNPTFEVPSLESYRPMVERVLVKRREEILNKKFSHYKLSEEQIDSYHSNGFILLKDVLTPEQKQSVVDWTNDIQGWAPTPGKHMVYYEKDAKQQDQKMLCRTENFLPFHDDMRKLLAEDGPIIDVLEQIMNERPVVFKEKINYKQAGGGGFPPHQDAPAFTSFGQRNHLTLNIAVDAANPENGCLEVAPGHHKVGLFPQDPIHHGLSAEEESKLKNWVHVPLEVGDVLIFSSWLPHRSGGNTSDKSRRALYITYNGKTDGDFRERYYITKRKEFPQECERVVGVDYSEGAKTFNIATPIIS